LVPLVALSFLACQPAPATSAPPRAAPVAAAPANIAVPRTIVTPSETTSVDELFVRGRAAFEAHRWDEAMRAFDRIVELDPDGPRAKEAWLDSGAAHDAAGDLEGAATRYGELARRFPEDVAGRDALVRAIRILAYLERWPEVGRAADPLLSRLAELTSIERVVVYGGKALSLVFSEQPDAAEYFISKGRDIVDAERLDAAGALPRDLAQLYFALGELRRIRAERIHLEPVPPNFAVVLEQRCQLLLDAQSAYSDTMRAYDAHWSAMAGYRVGELYRNLHSEVMRIPPPKAATTSAKAQLFEGAMRLRYSVLLQKGLTMMEHTLDMAKRTGEQSTWVLRAAEAKQGIEQAMSDETAALAKLPYSREQLEQALTDLGRRAAK
jgi:tetratricopeptide (TPR) repeat protein